MDRAFSSAPLPPSWEGVRYFCFWERHLPASLVSPKCCWGMGWALGTPSTRRGGSAPAVTTAAKESPPAMLLPPPHWGNHASPFPEINLRCYEGNSGVKLRCNSGIKSFTWSQFLTWSNLHYYADFSLNFFLSIISLLQFSASFERLKFFLYFDKWKRKREGKGKKPCPHPKTK